jgi:hypothetical protein
MKHKWEVKLSTEKSVTVEADYCTVLDGIITFYRDYQDPKHPRQTRMVLEAFTSGEWKHCKLIP